MIWHDHIKGKEDDPMKICLLSTDIDGSIVIFCILWFCGGEIKGVLRGQHVVHPLRQLFGVSDPTLRRSAEKNN